MLQAIGPRSAVPADRPRRQARLCVSLLFFLNGTVMASWATRIPAIADRLGLTTADLAMVLLGLSVGSVAGPPMAGCLLARVRSASLIRATLPVYAVALVAASISHSMLTLLFALIVLGIGNGILDVATNVAAVRIEQRYPRQIMSTFHAHFSLGALVGASFGVGAAALEIPVAVHLLLTATVVLLAGASATLGIEGMIPARTPTDTTRRARPIRPRMMVLGLLAFCCLLTEGAIYDWSAVYVHTSLHGSAAVAALALAVFLLSITAARFFVDRIVDRIGPVIFIRAAALLVCTAVCLVIFANTPVKAVVGFGILGLSLAGIVPTIMSSAGRMSQPEFAVAVVSTVGYTGFLVGPGLIGTIAIVADLRHALWIMALAALIVCIGAQCTRLDNMRTG